MSAVLLPSERSPSTLRTLTASMGLGAVVFLSLVALNNTSLLWGTPWAAVAGAATIAGIFVASASRFGVNPLTSAASAHPPVFAAYIANGGFTGLTPLYLTPLVVADEALPVAVLVGIVATIFGRRSRSNRAASRS